MTVPEAARPPRRRAFRSAWVAATAAAAVALAPAQAAYAQQTIRDAEIEETLHLYADPLLTAAGLAPDDVEIILIADRQLNAFATPGQIIGLHTGLIVETENPNQLKGVVAHEICHIACGHTARSGEMMRAGITPFVISLGLGVLAAMAGQPAAGALLASHSGYFATLNILTYSRTQEASADQAAAGYLEATGQSGRGLVKFFDKYRYQEVFSEARRFPYFRSHPISSDRISALRRRVEAAPHYAAADSQADIERHVVMQAKLEGFLYAPQQTFVKYKETDKRYPARYARAIAYFKASEIDKALKAVDALLAEHPDNPYLWELKGQILFEGGRGAQAIEPHRRSVELKPDSPLLRLNLGQALLGGDKPGDLDLAIRELQRAVATEKRNALGWRLLAEAWDRKGEPGRARLAAAEQYYMLGDQAQAKVFASRARDQLTENTPEWRRAMDIIQTARPTERELREIARERRDTGL